MNAQTQHIKKNPIIPLLILLLSAAILIIGCSAAPTAAPMAAQEEMARSMEAPAAEAPAQFDNAVDSVTADRLVIQNANLSLVVDDPEASKDVISALADSLGGYVVSARVYQEQLDDGRTVVRAAVTIRVPSERLGEALQQIRGLSDQPPISDNIDSQDVTAEYTDLEARLRNEEAAEAQLVKIMEDANRTEDVLNVYRELVQVRQRIEQIKGQMQYYEQSAALSAVAVELIPNEAVQPIEIGGWQPFGVAKDAIQALINSAKFILKALIWIVIYILPVLVILFVIFGLPVLLIVRWQRRRKAKASQAQIAPENPAQSS
jgi:chemotaxis protein histidine kinase CheA